MSKPRVLEIDGYAGEIVEERYNPLIKRREVVLRIAHIGKTTPSRGAVRVGIARHYGVDVARVVVKRVVSERGMGVSRAHVHIYDSVDRLKEFEPEYIIKRDEQSLQLYELKRSQEGGGSSQ